MTVGLLERKSTGGAVARIGFEYQDAFVLQNLPKWLAQSAFSHVISEAVGDFEVCYFGPAGKTRRVMYEAKNHALTPTDFHDEIARFKDVHDAAPSEFVRFCLVCKDYNSSTNPLVSKLQRIRGVGASYAGDSEILVNDHTDFIEWAIAHRFSRELAEFAFNKVDFLTYSAESADAAFSGELESNLPSLDLGGRDAARFRDVCKGHIARSSFGPIYRREFEASICAVLGANSTKWTEIPIKIQVSEVAVPFQELGLVVDSFVGPLRATKDVDEWRELADSAHDIGTFIKNSTSRSCIQIDGKQRMSMACMLGNAFRATKGFTLFVEHNGYGYCSGIHSKTDDVFFEVSTKTAKSGLREGIACIGFPTPIGSDIGGMLPINVAPMPKLVLESAKAISGIEDLNLAVMEAKAALVKFRSENQLTKVNLFIKAPSVFSMFFGHRANAICSIKLYDWVEGRYVPTVLLSE